MKEQDKTPEKLYEVEIGNLPGKEFRIMIVKMIQDVRKRMEAKKPALLSNRDGYLLELTGWTQGSQAS